MYVIRHFWDDEVQGVYTTKEGAEKFVNKISDGCPEDYIIERFEVCE